MVQKIANYPRDNLEKGKFMGFKVNFRGVIYFRERYQQF